MTARPERGDPLYPLYAYRLSILLSFTLALALTLLPCCAAWASRAAWPACPPLAYAFCDFNMLHVPHLNHVSAAFLLPLTALDRRPPVRAAARRPALVVAAVVLAAGVYFTELVVFIWMAAGLALALAVALPVHPRRTSAAWRRCSGRAGVAAALLAFVLIAGSVRRSTGPSTPARPRTRARPRTGRRTSPRSWCPRPDTTPLYGERFRGMERRGQQGHRRPGGLPRLPAPRCWPPWDSRAGRVAGRWSPPRWPPSSRC